MTEINEQKREKIKEEVKRILDNFSKALEKVKFKERKEKKGVGGFREEGEGMKSDLNFRKRMFENAPNKSEDFVIAEKKKW